MSDFLYRLDAKTLATRDVIPIATSERRLVYANRAALDFLGYSLEELQQRDLLDWIALLPRMVCSTHPTQPHSPARHFEVAFVR